MGLVLIACMLVVPGSAENVDGFQENGVLYAEFELRRDLLKLSAWILVCWDASRDAVVSRHVFY